MKTKKKFFLLVITEKQKKFLSELAKHEETSMTNWIVSSIKNEYQKLKAVNSNESRAN